MRLTLEELKTMSNEDLSAHWKSGQFPFDMIPTCHACLTIHWQGWCHVEEHSQLRAAAKQNLRRINGRTNSVEAFRANLEELYALRLFYDSLYPPAPAAAEQQVAEAREDSNVLT